MKLLKYKFPLLFFFIICHYNSNGQIKKGSFPLEKSVLFTDRTTYVTGEQINFSFSLINSYHSNNTLSKIYYVEIITPNGESVCNGKYSFDNLATSNYLAIPQDIASGKYYIRAYTKYMRNFGPSSYSYIPLTIINPNKNQVIDENPLDTNLVKTIKHEQIKKDSCFIIETDKAKYLTREEVKVKIREQFKTEKKIKNLCISVIPKFTYNEGYLTFKSQNNIDSLTYLPEIISITLTGKIVDKSSKRPLNLKQINLSILDNDKDFYTTRTDQFGRFYFSLPNLTNRRDVFLQVENNETDNATILIDNDLCKSPVSLIPLHFNLSEDEKKAILNLARNNQIKQAFSKHLATNGTHNLMPFYGSSQTGIDLEQYISLPSLEDYFKELLPIRVVKNHNKKTLKIINANGESLSNPLLLLDLVVFSDVNKILALPPHRISRIELVNEPYIRGGITYQGVVSIFSKKGDFAGIDLPATGVLLGYDFMYNNSARTEINSSQNTPDARNTLFWNPNYELNEETFSFSTSDSYGDYLIVLRGVYEDGSILYTSNTISVSDN